MQKPEMMDLFPPQLGNWSSYLMLFEDCCNEFWWVSTYVAKGLCREEILFASEHLISYVRPMLLKMIIWRVGLETDFSLSIGKSNKYLEKYLSKEMWERLLKTYENHSYSAIWKSLFISYELFRENANLVSEKLDFLYPNYDEKVSSYVERLYQESDLK